MRRFWMIPCILAAVFSLGCARKADEEIHLIPEGYVGPVVILFDRPGGQPLESGRRIYRIGSDGVAVVAAPANPGIGAAENWKYFYVSPDGRRRPIPQDDVPPDALQVFGAGLGSVGIPVGPSREMKNVTVMAYFVGIPSSRSDWGRLGADWKMAAIKRVLESERTR